MNTGQGHNRMSSQPAHAATPPRTGHMMAWIIGIALFSLAAIIVASIVIPKPQLSDIDLDYTDVTQSMCYHMPGATSSVAPYPADQLTPIGQTANTRATRFSVPAPARQETSLNGKKARGVFVVVRIAAQAQEGATNSLDTDPVAYQLVDRNGLVHCVVPSLTESSNPSYYTPTGQSQYWKIRLRQGSPPSTFILVFDLDPSLVAGAYISGMDMGSLQRASLNVGL